MEAGPAGRARAGERRGMNVPIATIRSQDDLIEALRAAKEMRNLSFKTLDALGDFTEGHMERVIGPRREKGMSPFVFQMLCSLLAVKLEMVFDPDQANKMEAKWEGRDTSNVRLEKGRVSKSLLERAKPHVLKDFAKAGGKASGAMRTGSQGSEIMRKIAKQGWRTRRRTLKERLAEHKAFKAAQEQA
ncbi:hypothetical protein [Bradyrhizobium sp. Arg816]|uniref:hypothetical protein n=1 Tax=Bradyrhizobium sp. Arg816 TaxID=2998491 RepID=UPI00249E2992|nr:hypothetical protein [Bradyrhizobium sp. Arg816]MDI3563544.1 hypothetical protein [Bradyrhizobium sp. Arg816]